MGRPARGALHVDRSSTCSAWSGSRSLGRRFGGSAAGGDARVRVGGLPVHAVRLELEHERRDPAGVPDPRALARRRSPVGARRSRRARRAGRSSARSSSRPLWLSYPERSGGREPSCASLAGFALATLAAFSVLLLEPNPLHAIARLLRPHVRLAARARLARSRSGTGGSTTPGCPTCTSSSARSRCCSSLGAVALVLPPAAEVAAPARRAHRRAPDRLRARADALVLPLHPVVLPVRRGRGARGRAAARARTRRRA